MKALHIGISGWRYAPWRGDFYPQGLRQKDELRYASRAFNSIELNGSFYSLQKPEYYRRWAQDTPEGFVFSLKGPRYITHIRRLRDAEEGLANFFASSPWSWARSSGRCSGNCRPACSTTRTWWKAFWRCCRAPARPRWTWRRPPPAVGRRTGPGR